MSNQPYPQEIIDSYPLGEVRSIVDESQVKFYLDSLTSAVAHSLVSPDGVPEDWSVWKDRVPSMCAWGFQIAKRALSLEKPFGQKELYGLVAVQYLAGSAGDSWMTPDMTRGVIKTKSVPSEFPNEPFCWCTGKRTFKTLHSDTSINGFFVCSDCLSPVRAWARAAVRYIPYINVLRGGPLDDMHFTLQELLDLDSKDKLDSYKLTFELEENWATGEELCVWKYQTSLV